MKSVSDNNRRPQNNYEEVPFDPNMLNQMPQGYTPGMYQAGYQAGYRAAMSGQYAPDAQRIATEIPVTNDYYGNNKHPMPQPSNNAGNGKRKKNTHNADSREASRNDNGGRERAPFILRLFSRLLFFVMLVLSIVDGVMLVNSGMLPFTYELAAIGILLLMLIIVYALIRGGRSKGRCTTGMVFSILLSIMYGMLFYYVFGGIDTLSKITGIKYETVVGGVYVRMDDPAEEIEDLRGYSFGIAQTQDRENTEYFVEQVSEDVGRDIETTEYSDMITQVNALLTGEVDAVIMNSNNIHIISEMDGYADIEDRIREIKQYTRSQLVRTAPDDDADIEAGEPFAVYISGIDTYGDISGTSRSDVNIVGIVNPRTRQILLISTPRDYYVPLPDSNGVRDKLTHAGLYGVDCSVGTLEMLYDIDIQYNFRVNFSGFQEIVDALGGITVYSDMSFSAFQGRYHFNAGANNLNGEQALAFARERKSFADGDRQRGRNQMLVIRAIVDRMTSPAILTEYSSVMAGLEGSFQTSIPYELVSYLVSDQLDDSTAWDIQQYSVNGANSSGTTYSIPSQVLYVMEPDMNTVNQAREYISQVLEGEDISDRITVAQ